MPHDTGSRRLTRPATAKPHAGAADAALPALISVLTRAERLTDALPTLHQHALDVTHGSCSLLFEHNPRNAVMQATSGFGLDELRTDPWTPEPAEAEVVNAAFRRKTATFVSNLEHQMPDLAQRLHATSALVLPLARGKERIGLLAIGFAEAPDAAAVRGDSIEIADTFLMALELFRLRRNEELQRDLRELLEAFSASISATLNVASGLDLFCHGSDRLFGADRTSVWIHDRRARQLVLQASSEPRQLSRGVRVSADDLHSPAAAAMRRSRAEILPAPEDAVTSTVTVPLRGTRRALGSIVFDGVRVEPGGELDLLDRADELGRQLSSAIENMQLLDDVIRSRRELENTFDSIAHLVVVSDKRGRIVHANEAFASRLKTTRDELLDRPLTDCIGPELGGWLAELGREGVQHDGQAAAVREIFDPVLNGPFMITVTDLLDHDHDRVGSVVVARDLTPQSRLEAEREELRKRLTQSEKLAALGQFVAGIAHELNNPLQGVLGHLELLRVTGAFPKQLRREIGTIYREADRAAKIVRNLLVFAGSRRLARRAVSLNAVLHKVVALRQAACRSHDIELVRHYDDQLPRVQSDPLLLHQVFLNMVMNAEQAVAATGRPGRIEIRTAIAAGRDRIVATVRDTGSGIPNDALPRIFEPFYTTKEVGKGTGLGLAIAYGIVQEHGGDIVAANHPDGGAIFTVELPVGKSA
jgi:signal transduction histidine kinase